MASDRWWFVVPLHVLIICGLCSSTPSKFYTNSEISIVPYDIVAEEHGHSTAFTSDLYFHPVDSDTANIRRQDDAPNFATEQTNSWLSSTEWVKEKDNEPKTKKEETTDRSVDEKLKHKKVTPSTLETSTGSDDWDFSGLCKYSGVRCETHNNYKTMFITNKDIGRQYWVNLDNNADVKMQYVKNVEKNIMVNLKFDFPFYGEKLRSIVIKPNGILELGDNNSVPQIIDPFMANFDTKSEESVIKYADNGVALTVQWENMLLQDKRDAGAFTFQVILHKNGDMVIVFVKVPLTEVKQFKSNHNNDASEQIIFYPSEMSNWTVLYYYAPFSSLEASSSDVNSESTDSTFSDLDSASQIAGLSVASLEQYISLSPNADGRSHNIRKRDVNPVGNNADKMSQPLYDSSNNATTNNTSINQPKQTGVQYQWHSTTVATDKASKDKDVPKKKNNDKNSDTPDKSLDDKLKHKKVTSSPVESSVSTEATTESKVKTNATVTPPMISTKKSTDITDMSDELGDISISKFSNQDLNSTILAKHNITQTQNDTHMYYNSMFIMNETIAKQYWVDLDNHPNLKINTVLSKSHRRAATVELKFDFPFYGHKVRNITIATGGFLYTGKYVHSWLAATQYIAPLMANFDTTLSEESVVKYADNGTAFTVEWEKVSLQDKPLAGTFTFQVTLHKNGDIVFVYAKIPITVESIEDSQHPVKIGLSDAYIMDRTIFFVRRKTIYEYHRVIFDRHDIRNWTVIYLTALPTCLDFDNCHDCLTKVTDFECKWCTKLNQCSTGTSRNRQDWIDKGCNFNNIREVAACPNDVGVESIVKTKQQSRIGYSEVDSAGNLEPGPQVKGLSIGSLEHSTNKVPMSVSGVIGILLAISLVAGLGAWVVYAYRNPHSVSGQMLIRYRPSQWSWRRGEPRYTAATIHM